MNAYILKKLVARPSGIGGTFLLYFQDLKHECVCIGSENALFVGNDTADAAPLAEAVTSCLDFLRSLLDPVFAHAQIFVS